MTKIYLPSHYLLRWLLSHFPISVAFCTVLNHFSIHYIEGEEDVKKDETFSTKNIQYAYTGEKFQATARLLNAFVIKGGRKANTARYSTAAV